MNTKERAMHKMTLDKQIEQVVNDYIAKSKQSNEKKLQAVSNALIAELSYIMAFTAKELDMPLEDIMDTTIDALKHIKEINCGDTRK
jgi:hypothetical protein